MRPSWTATAGWLTGKSGRIIVVSALLIITAVFFAQMYARANRSEGYDFTSYLLSSEALFSGEDPYATESPFPYIYPLFLCVIIAPLTAAPYWLANAIWFAAGLLALGTAAAWVLRLFRPSISFWEILAVTVLPALALVDVVMNNLLNGQVNFIVLFLCVLFLRELLSGKQFIAAIALGAAIAIKLTPAVLLLYLVMHRDYKTATLALITAVLFVAGIPYLVAGPMAFAYTNEYANSFVLGSVASESGLAAHHSFSLTALFGLIMPMLPAFAIAFIAAVGPAVYLQGRALRTDSATPLQPRIAGDAMNAREVSIFSMYLLAILLISPMSETHHLINLLPALLIVTGLAMFKAPGHIKYTGVLIAGVFIMQLAAKAFFPSNGVAIVALYGALLMVHSGVIGGKRLAALGHA